MEGSGGKGRGEEGRGVKWTGVESLFICPLASPFSLLSSFRLPLAVAHVGCCSQCLPQYLAEASDRQTRTTTVCQQPPTAKDRRGRGTIMYYNITCISTASVKYYKV